MSKITIQANTDAVDIEAKCLGVSCWIDGDSTNQLNTNRGLHIQIRHNKDKKTFDAANQVSKLITNAPAMLHELRKAEHALMLLREGKRDGATMGHCSEVLDSITAIINRSTTL